MEKINGKEGWIALAEVETGFRKVNDQELAYIHKQCRGFGRWLLSEGRNVKEATAICQAIYDNTIKLLKENTFNDFIWSRGNGVSSAEINILSKFEEDAAKDEEYFMFTEYWQDINDIKSVPHTNAVGFMGYTPDHWLRIKEKIEPVHQVLDHYERYEVLTERHKKSLRNLKEYVRKLRFGVSTGWKNKKIRSVHGDGVYISNTIWKKMVNRITELLGEGKKYTVKESEKTETRQDVMDNNPIYGFDMERI